MTPSATVIVTNHDYEPYVADAIESVLAQTEAAELVVVDDGSTDGSADVIRRFEDVATTIFQPNAGQAAAMNAGYVASNSAIVCFLDADDRLAPTAMRTAREALEPGVVGAHWRLCEVDGRGRRTGGMRPRRELGEGDLRGLLIERGPDSYAHPPTSGSAWARWFLDRVMPLPELERELGIGSASADAYLATLAPLHGRLACAPDGQGDYRLHETSDYSGTGFSERLTRDLATYDARCRALSQECARVGVEPDADRWRQGAWITRLARAAETIEATVPSGQPFLLIDDAEWAMDALHGRRAVPFPERDGRWWGPPADGHAAVCELERARAQGVRHVVVGWPAWWWLGHYGQLYETLRSDAKVLRRSDDVLIFEFVDAEAA